MKRFLKTLAVIAVVLIIGICLAKELGIFSISQITAEQINNYTNYYYDKLELDEKTIYLKIDEAIRNKDKKVTLGIGEYEDVKLNEKVSKVLTAYFYDNPEIYYLSNEYVITVRDLKVFETVTIKLKYITKDIETKNEELETAITKFLSQNVKSGMTDFEKELAIHDALVQQVDYYEYEDINAIPTIKHTAYGALVENEAVCDGFSKAFKLLLEREGIESVIINGITNNTLHAWNLVKLGNDYYHVDVTSDNIKDGNNKYTIHTYFNVTDSQIKKTHAIGEVFSHPKCSVEKYEYYKYKGLYISYEDGLYSKMRKIISNSRNSKILELRADKRYYAQTIIDALYDLDFNNWLSSGKTKIEYNKVGDIYVFIK